MQQEKLALNCCDEWIRISKTEEVLSFDKFMRVKNNFHLHFVVNFVGCIYRTQDAFQKCVKDNSGFHRVVQWLNIPLNYSSDEYPIKLYEAYKMMREYAKSNWEMFQ